MSETPKIIQPLEIDPGFNALRVLAPGDTIRCEAGCDYAKVSEAGVSGKLNGCWPKLEMLNLNIPALGQIIPIKCNCGAVAIKWGDGAL